MLILRFYDLIGGIPMKQEITWSTQLLTWHSFHRSRFLSWRSAVNSDGVTALRK